MTLLVLLVLIIIQLRTHCQVRHFHPRGVHRGGSINVHALLGRRLRPAVALADAGRDRHDRAAARAHGEARVLRQNKDAATADARDAELLNGRDGRTHRAAHARGADGVGKGDMAALAAYLPRGLWLM